MFKPKHTLFCLGILLLLHAFVNPLAAQEEFLNQELKVGKFQPVTIKFEEEIVNYTLPTCKGMYELERSSNGKSVDISCLKDNLGQQCFLTLVVGDGKKQHNHTFKLIYREEIPESEMVYDYTDKKVLKAALKANEDALKSGKSQVAKADPPAVKTDPVPAMTKETVQQKTTPAPNTQAPAKPAEKPAPATAIPEKSTASTTAANDYTSIVNKAYEAFDRAAYAEASVLLKKALEIRPDDRVATSLKKDVDAKLEEQRIIVEKVRKENYYKAIGSAEMAANSRDFDKAESYYNEAKEFEDPGSSYVKSRLADIAVKKKNKEEDDRRNRELKEKEDNYLNAKSLADIAYNKGDMEYAKQQYRLALTFKEQDTYANNKLIEIDNRIAKEKRDQELAVKQAQYNGARGSADDFFNKEQFELARAAYNEALRYSPGDAYVTNRLKEIDASIVKKRLADAQLERENKYKDIVTSADAAFNAGGYEFAMEKYTEAAKWLPGESYPAKKIAEIKGLQKASAQRAEEERKELERQKKLDNDYAVAVKKADDFMNRQDFNNAKTLYNQAISLKPYEQYPKDKLSDMENILAGMAAAAKARKDSVDAVIAKKAKYNDAVARGKKANAIKDYPGAKAAFSEALVLIDTASYPAAQIAGIDKLLSDIAAKEQARVDSVARVRAFNEKYDSVMFAGANAMILENFEDAIISYEIAIKMKPEDIYARNLLRYTLERKTDKITKTNIAKEEELENAYRIAKKDGITAMKERRYAEARVLFGKALSLMVEGKDYGNDKEYLLNRLAAIDYTLSRAAETGEVIQPVVVSPSPSPVNEPEPTVKTPEQVVTEPVLIAPEVNKSEPAIVATEVVENKPAEVKPEEVASAVKNSTLPHQNNPIPFTKEELIKLYPDWRFSEPPPGQGFNVAEYYDTLENARLSQLVIVETDNRVNISDTQDGITLTCEGISFSGTNAFYRFKIQNNSKEAFPVGVLALVWQKFDGNEIKLYPGYVSSFPLLMPSKEINIVYVAKSAYISVSEALIFTMRDRSKKTRLTLRIPGNIYNKESNR